MSRFALQRIEDVTGVSGVGFVAQGVKFDDGSCALRWLTATRSTAVYASIDDLRAVHCHHGATVIHYLDAGDDE